MNYLGFIFTLLSEYRTDGHKPYDYLYLKISQSEHWIHHIQCSDWMILEYEY